MNKKNAPIDRAADRLQDWATLLLVIVAAAALGCGGGGSSGSSSSTETDDADTDMDMNMGTGSGSDDDDSGPDTDSDSDDDSGPGTDSGDDDSDSGSDDDSFDDFFDDFDDFFDDDDGDGIPDPPDDFDSDDLPDLDGATITGTWTGAGAAFGDCVDPTVASFDASVSFTFDGAGSVTFDVTYVIAQMGFNTTLRYTGTGDTLQIGDDTVSIFAMNATVQASSDAGSGAATTFSSPFVALLINVNDGAGTAEFAACEGTTGTFAVTR